MTNGSTTIPFSLNPSVSHLSVSQPSAPNPSTLSIDVERAQHLLKQLRHATEQRVEEPTHRALQAVTGLAASHPSVATFGQALEQTLEALSNHRIRLNKEAEALASDTEHIVDSAHQVEMHSIHSFGSMK